MKQRFALTIGLWVLLCSHVSLQAWAVKPTPTRLTGKYDDKPTDQSLKRKSSWLSVNTGVLIHDVLRKGRVPPGGSSSAADLKTASPYSIPIGVEYGFHLSDSLFMAPALALTPFAQKSYGGETQAHHAFISGKVGYQLKTRAIQVYAGPGIWFNRLKGSGKVVTQSNGYSVAEFSSPGSTVTTRQFLIRTGTTYSSSEFHVDLDAFVPGVLTRRRSLMIVLGIGYDFSI